MSGWVAIEGPPRNFHSSRFDESKLPNGADRRESSRSCRRWRCGPNQQLSVRPVSPDLASNASTTRQPNRRFTCRTSSCAAPLAALAAEATIDRPNQYPSPSVQHTSDDGTFDEDYPWWENTLTGDWGGWRTELAQRGIVFDIHYVSLLMQNSHGGFDTGFVGAGSVRGHDHHRHGKTLRPRRRHDLLRLGIQSLVQRPLSARRHLRSHGLVRRREHELHRRRRRRAQPDRATVLRAILAPRRGDARPSARWTPTSRSPRSTPPARFRTASPCTRRR